jgi:hypothetical protein
MLAAWVAFIPLILKHIFWICCAFWFMHGLVFAGALSEVWACRFDLARQKIRRVL